jgi:hypothetical protein
VPATIVGLVVVALVALPGLAYHFAASRKRPGESFASYSPRIVASGLVFSLATLAALALVGDYWVDGPLTSPADLAKGTTDYLAVHTRRLVWTGLLLLGTSVLLAWVAGHWAGMRRLLRPDRPYYGTTDPWWVVLKEEPKNEGPAYAYVELRDGASVGGYVTWFSPQSSAYGDRDLVLIPWAEGIDDLWRHSAANKARLRRLFLHPDPQRVDVSLRTVIPGDQIARLHVRYLWDSKVKTFIDALRRWADENTPRRIQVGHTMVYAIVTIDGDQPMRIRRKDGSVRIHLGVGMGAGKAFLIAHGTKVRLRRHAYEVSVAALLDSEELHPEFTLKILEPMIAKD